MERKLPKLIVPQTGTASADLRMAIRFAERGDHGWAAAHYRVASVLLVAAGRVSAGNRAWAKYRKHKHAYFRGEGPAC
jgi:hypothetical protein